MKIRARHTFVAGLTLVLVLLGFGASFLVQIRSLAFAVIFNWTEWLKPFFSQVDRDWLIHVIGFVLVGLAFWGLIHGVRGFVGKLLRIGGGGQRQA